MNKDKEVDNTASIREEIQILEKEIEEGIIIVMEGEIDIKDLIILSISLIPMPSRLKE